MRGSSPNMTKKTSIVYSHIFIYRMLMNVIYTGSYKKRFDAIMKCIATYKPGTVLELCFGDTIIANYCKQKNINWFGIDINETFVNRATK